MLSLARCTRERAFQEISAGFLLVLLSGISAAQTNSQKPDFNGKWLLKSPKSEYEITLTISQQDPKMEIVRLSKKTGYQSETHFTYFTDGRGEANTHKALTRDARTMNTKTRQKGRTIEVKGSATGSFIGVGPLSGTSNFVEEWELSTDGKSLTHRITETPLLPPVVPFEEIESYKKVE